MSILFAPLLLFAPDVVGNGASDGAAASKQAQPGHQILRATGPSAPRFPAGGRLAPGAALDLERGDSVLLLGPLGTRRYRGPGRFRVGEPAGLNAVANNATVRITAAVVRSPGGSIRMPVLAGGAIDIAEGIGRSCSGFVSEAPDAQFTSDGKGIPIVFSVLDRGPRPAAGTLSLLVNDPMGNWYCSQGVDAAGNPAIHFPRQRAGRYDIWVGYSTPDVRRVSALDIVD